MGVLTSRPDFTIQKREYLVSGAGTTLSAGIWILLSYRFLVNFLELDQVIYSFVFQVYVALDWLPESSSTLT